LRGHRSRNGQRAATLGLKTLNQAMYIRLATLTSQPSGRRRSPHVVVRFGVAAGELRQDPVVGVQRGPREAEAAHRHAKH
jgi:hypothetical protein